MQATEAPTPISQRNETLLAAKRAQEQREQGIRANGIKQGRELERKEIQERAGVSMIEELSMLAQVRLEHDASDRANELRWMREEQKAMRGARWAGAFWGVIIGLCAGITVSSVGFMTVVDRAMQTAFDRASEFGSAQAMLGAAVQRNASAPQQEQEPRTVNEQNNIQ